MFASTITSFNVDSSSIFFTPSDERSFCLLLDNNPEENKVSQKSKTKIYVSKELLAVASPVFKKIFYGGNFYQARIEPSKEYYLADKKIDDVLEFLTCLFPYRDRKKIDQSNARLVLPLAVEFEVEILTKKCLKAIRNWKLNYSIGDETVLKDLPMFVKYGMTNLVKEAVPYAAALPLEVLAAHRRKKSPHMPGNHAFYSAVYEAKANRANNETHVSVAVSDYKYIDPEDECSDYDKYEKTCYCGEIVHNRCAKCAISLCDECKPEKCLKFHRCQTYGRRMSSCICGYDFDEQFLTL